MKFSRYFFIQLTAYFYFFLFILSLARHCNSTKSMQKYTTHTGKCMHTLWTHSHRYLLHAFVFFIVSKFRSKYNYCFHLLLLQQLLVAWQALRSVSIRFLANMKSWERNIFFRIRSLAINAGFLPRKDSWSSLFHFRVKISFHVRDFILFWIHFFSYLKIIFPCHVAWCRFISINFIWISYSTCLLLNPKNHLFFSITTLYDFSKKSSSETA